MATYPIKVLKDETGVPFVPLVSSTGITSPDGTTLEDSLNSKLEKNNIIAGDNIILEKDGNNITITGTASGAANVVIDNLETTSPKQGVLDARQGYVLNNKITEMAETLEGGIPKVINNLTTVDTVNALSAYQGYLLNNKFNDYLPLSGGTLTGTVYGRMEGKTQTIIVDGDVDTYYPVVITLTKDKSVVNYVSIWKNLGSITNSTMSGNHSNGTSSMWLMYEVRYRGWDGNGGMVKTIRYSMPYANLCAHTTTSTKNHGGLIVYLRGGGNEYKITTNFDTSINIYYEETNLGSSEYTDYVTPCTSTDNLGKYTTDTIIGNISGSATSATTASSATRATQDGDGNTISSTYLKRSGGEMTGSPYIYFPATAGATTTSMPMALTYGRLQAYGTLCINADTDGSTTEYLILTAGRGMSSSAADGLAIGYNTLQWRQANVPTVYVQSSTPSAKQTGDIWVM